MAGSRQVESGSPYFDKYPAKVCQGRQSFPALRRHGQDPHLRECGSLRHLEPEAGAFWSSVGRAGW